VTINGNQSRKLIIFGGGRMGLSHAAMAGLLDPHISILIIEPNALTRALLTIVVGKGIRIRSKATASDVEAATHALIATPPKIHLHNVRLLREMCFTGRLLIEKPFAVTESDINSFSTVMSGYVLKHSSNWLTLKAELSAHNIEFAEVILETNQDFSSEGGGWRAMGNNDGQLLLHEFGSHCISLILDLFSVDEFKLCHHEANSVTFESTTSIPARIRVMANSSDVRKSVYCVRVRTESCEYYTNFYELKKLDLNGKCVDRRTLASEGVHTAAYLRGEDFARQMGVFLSEQIVTDDRTTAIDTDRLLENLTDQFECRK